MTKPNDPRLEGAPNFRDIGGCKTADGRAVRRGRLFRSEILTNVSDRDLSLIADLGIEAVCDLRSPAERSRQQNRWPAGRKVQTLSRPIIADMSAVQPNEWKKRLADPQFDEGQARQTMIEVYREMPNAFATELTALFARLADPNCGGILIHCAAGKDRTGFVCAMLLWTLGVPRDAIMADYLLSQERYSLRHASQILNHYFEGRPTEHAQAVFKVIAGVSPDYLAAAIERIENDHGSVDAYLRKHAGLDDGRRAHVHANLLAD